MAPARAMALFTLGNLLSALSPNYAVLLAARVVTSLCHGAFFGVGSSGRRKPRCAGPARKRGRRDVHGADDRQHRWRPARHLGRPASWLACGTCRHRRPWCDRDPGATACLAETRGGAAVERGAGTRRHATSGGAASRLPRPCSSGAMFTVFTYIAPILQSAAHVSEGVVTLALVIYGVGLTIGNCSAATLRTARCTSRSSSCLPHSRRCSCCSPSRCDRLCQRSRPSSPGASPLSRSSPRSKRGS